MLLNFRPNDYVEETPWYKSKATLVSLFMHLPLIIGMISFPVKAYLDKKEETSKEMIINIVRITKSNNATPKEQISKSATLVSHAITSPEGEFKKKELKQSEEGQETTSDVENTDTQGSTLGNTAEEDNELERYEQVIALWINKYRRHLDASLLTSENKVVPIIRMRVRKDGGLSYLDFHKRTFNPALDNEIKKMIRTASPFPPIPDSYSTEREVEFLLPISLYTN
jgi:outer membrane biosynthesis protein TonB